MQWQPIETAPKDGSQVLIAIGRRIEIAAWNENAEYDRFEVAPGWQVFACEDGYYSVAIEKPTHWMPVPDPPDHIRDATKMVPDSDNCRWWQDYHGNWCCSCRATMPQFTPWRGTSPTGHNCPYCRRIIWMEPRYDESIHSCGPHCERPACVARRTDSGEFRSGKTGHDQP